MTVYQLLSLLFDNDDLVIQFYDPNGDFDAEYVLKDVPLGYASYEVESFHIDSNAIMHIKMR